MGESRLHEIHGSLRPPNSSIHMVWHDTPTYCSFDLSTVTQYTLVVQAEQSIRYVCLCVQMITFELHDSWPRYLPCTFILNLSRSSPNVKVMGQSLRSQVLKCQSGWCNPERGLSLSLHKRVEGWVKPEDAAPPPDQAERLSAAVQSPADGRSWWRSRDWHRSESVWREVPSSVWVAGRSSCAVPWSGQWCSEAQSQVVSRRHRRPAAVAHDREVSLPTALTRVWLSSHSVPE